MISSFWTFCNAMVAAPPPPTIHASNVRITKRRPEGEAKPESYHIDSLEPTSAVIINISRLRHGDRIEDCLTISTRQAVSASGIAKIGKSADVSRDQRMEDGF